MHMPRTARSTLVDTLSLGQLVPLELECFGALALVPPKQHGSTPEIHVRAYRLLFHDPVTTKMHAVHHFISGSLLPCIFERTNILENGCLDK